MRSLTKRMQVYTLIQTIAVVALIMAVLVLAVEISRIQSERKAEKISADRARISQCYQQTSTNPLIERTLSAIANLANKVGEHGVHDSVLDYAATLEANTPTKRDCDALADSLGVSKSP